VTSVLRTRAGSQSLLGDVSMKKIRHILAIIAIFASLLYIPGCGGIHYQKFARYAPITQCSYEPDSRFKPDISPTLYGTFNKTIIPLLLYYRGEKDGTAVITIETVHENDPRFGYDGIANVRFDSLVVELPDGTTKTLIKESEPVIVPLNTERWASRLFDLGEVDSEEMIIIASGVITRSKDDSQSPFTYNRAWRKNKSSRIKTGWSIME